jgi:hypothetical protein
MSHVKRVFGCLGGALLAGVMLFLALNALCVSRLVRERLTSPNGRAEALIVGINAGAATSYSYEVYIAEPGDSPRDGILVIRGLNGAFRARWTGAQAFEVVLGREGRFRDAERSITLDGMRYSITAKPGP